MRLIPILIIAIFFLIACKPTQSGPLPAKDILNPEGEIKTTPEGVKYIVHPSQLLRGGPPKDGIPSIDDPKFVSTQEADKWLEDNELMLAISHRGVERAYPFQILVFHEIVNDKIGDESLLITYCPLCGSGIAFKPLVRGISSEFGTTGMLYNSNLVMYDRLSDSFWTQIGGKAIIGEQTGETLELFPSDVIEWGVWKIAHPKGEVLSKETGHSRSYGNDPYPGYYTSDDVWFPLTHEDNRLTPKEVVIGIELNGSYKAYKKSDIDKLKLFNDTVGNERINIEKTDTGSIIITSQSSGKRIASERDFWFAWAAFHPETELFSP